ncbi:MAG: hypothetical protein AB7T14_06150 [Candidatus Methylacidiphilaceae bacterium]
MVSLPSGNGQRLPEVVASGLGDPEVDRLLNLSPCARTMLLEARRKKFKIKWGDPGKGTYCVPEARRIFIDPNLKGDPGRVAGVLCHELGHATSSRPGFGIKEAKRAEWIEENLPRALGRAMGSVIGQGDAGEALGRKVGGAVEKWTQDLYVAYNVRQDLTDEGHADMKLAACVRQAWRAAQASGDRQLMEEVCRMWEHGSEGLRKKEAALWEETQNGKLSMRKAEEEIGEYYADHEHPSMNPKRTYRQVYEENWRKLLDLHPKEPEWTGRRPGPGTGEEAMVYTRMLTSYRPLEGQGSWRTDEARPVGRER